MRKLILFVAVTALTSLSFISCSKDEDEKDFSADPIVGVWYEYSENGELSNECDKKAFTTYKSDGTVSALGIVKGPDGNCIDEGTTNGTWENIGNSTYLLKGKDPNSGEVFEGEIKVEFSDDKQSFTTVTYDNTYKMVTIYKKK